MAQDNNKGFMRKLLTAGVASLALMGGTVGLTSEAQARDRHHQRDNDTGEKILIGVAGLAIGAAIANNGNGGQRQDVQYQQQYQYQQRGNGGAYINNDYSAYPWSNDRVYVAQAENYRVRYQGTLDTAFQRRNVELSNCQNINNNAATRNLMRGKVFDWRTNLAAGNAFNQCVNRANNRYRMTVTNVDAYMQRELQRLTTRFETAAARGGARYSSPARTSVDPVQQACQQAQVASIRTGKPMSASTKQQCGFR
jgi:hypothetical protein